MDHRSVIIVCSDSTIYGAYMESFFDIEKYVEKCFFGPYSSEMADTIVAYLESAPAVKTIITRGIWYNRLLSMPYFKEHPEIRIERLIIDMPVGISELIDIINQDCRRIGLISINSPLGDDPTPKVAFPSFLGGSIFPLCIEDIDTDPTNQVIAHIEKYELDAIWGDIYELDTNRLPTIYKSQFLVRPETFRMLLRNAANYGSLYHNSKHNEELVTFLNTITNMVTEGIIAFNKTGRITTVNHNMVSSSLNITGRIGDSIEDVLGMPLTDIITMSANTVREIDGHHYILNLIKPQTWQMSYTIMISSARQISDNDLMIRTKLSNQRFPAKYTFSDIITKDRKSLEALTTAKAYASYDESLLINGETGTGKELYASAIHRAGIRSDKPFVAVNCATLSESLIDSELFGYEKGAFTGALSSGKKGLFEMAHEDTIFLDEISEIPIHMQTKLLRVLQERSLIRVGGSQVIPINVRVIAATNKDLIEQCRLGLFRYDLYYRLAVLELNLTPLRERPADIVPLFTYFLNRSNAVTGRKLYWADDSVFAPLYDCPWNGNIRELENVALRTIILANDFELTADTIRAALPQHYRTDKEKDSAYFKTPVTASLDDLEKDYLHFLLEMMDNDKDRVCRFLGISKPTLWRKLKTE